ncbi:cation/H(+) antiporter 15-like [Neltuma alba]|uniref:cation/H(+) antiporter 15-like n=1 Tax=Neltuma alba TaxID=207710 RepID=UPI0010A51FF1|nr:cation/H(+) antiporter 15-like [Prosopis alba]
MGVVHRRPGNGIISVDFDGKGNMNICVYNDRSPGSNGFFFGDRPFDFSLPVTLFQVFFIVLFSQLIFFVLRPIRTPRYMCQAGILVGPSFLGNNRVFKEQVFMARQVSVLAVASLIGLIYALFILALKMDIILTLRSARRTWKLGIISSLFSFWVMLGLIYMYSPESLPDLPSARDRILFCVNASLSNFAVISQSLMDLNLITSELGQIALSAAMINDIVHALSYLALYLVHSKEEGSQAHSLFLILVSFWGFVGSCVFIVRPALLVIARKTPTGKPVKKAYVVLILTSVLAMAFISDVIGLSFLFGPMFFGLIMPNGPPLGTTILEKTESLVNEFFLPLSWAFVGQKINVFGIWNWDVVSRINFVIIAGYVAKVIGCILISLTYKIRPKHGLILGLILNMKGIVEIINYTRMKRVEILDDQLYYFMVFSTVLTCAILHPFIDLLYKPYTRLDNHSKRYRPIRTIQNSYRNPEFCIICCIHSEGNVRSLMTLIEACNPVLSSAICAYVVHLVELLGKSTPFLLPVNLKRRRFSSFNYPITLHIMRAFENYAGNTDGLVTVMPFINVAPYKNMHEAVCNLAQDKLISFIVLPFHENDQSRGSLMTVTIRDLNRNFQFYAPCTVGILVDRFSQLSISTSAGLTFHVAIFFLGGADDREALALGNRMSDRPNVRISLFYFVVRNDYLRDGSSYSKKDDESDMFSCRYEGEGEEEERAWDESAIDEFKAKSLGNGNVFCEEIEVEDGIRVLETIRRLEGNYDLVMVGQRHSMEGLDDQGMCNFMENVETLGIVGDMLASTEFCNGMVPILVMRSAVQQLKRNNSLSSIAISQGSFL